MPGMKPRGFLAGEVREGLLLEEAYAALVCLALRLGQGHGLIRDMLLDIYALCLGLGCEVVAEELQLAGQRLPLLHPRGCEANAELQQDKLVIRCGEAAAIIECSGAL